MSKTKILTVKQTLACLEKGFMLMAPCAGRTTCEIVKPGKAGVYFETPTATWLTLNDTAAAEASCFVRVLLKEPGHVENKFIIHKSNKKALKYQVHDAPANHEELDYKEQFKLQKPLPKKQVQKLKPGTLIEVKWVDGPNEVAILLERMEREGKGSVSLRLYFVERRVTNTRADSDQVVKVIGELATNLDGSPRIDLR